MKKVVLTTMILAVFARISFAQSNEDITVIKMMYMLLLITG